MITLTYTFAKIPYMLLVYCNVFWKWTSKTKWLMTHPTELQFEFPLIPTGTITALQQSLGKMLQPSNRGFHQALGVSLPHSAESICHLRGAPYSPKHTGYLILVHPLGRGGPCTSLRTKYHSSNNTENSHLLWSRIPGVPKGPISTWGFQQEGPGSTLRRSSSKHLSGSPDGQHLHLGCL